jgi:hypothetical protein
MALGREYISVARTNGGADVFCLAGFLPRAMANLISATPLMSAPYPYSSGAVTGHPFGHSKSTAGCAASSRPSDGRLQAITNRISNSTHRSRPSAPRSRRLMKCRGVIFFDARRFNQL